MSGSVSETLGTGSVKTNRICDATFSPLIQSGWRGFHCIWGWSRGVASCQCVLASRPSAVLKAGWVPHRHFLLLAAQLRKDTKEKSLPAVYGNLHCAKLFWPPWPFPGAKGYDSGQASACYFSIKDVLAKCATSTCLCHIAVSPELWHHCKVSSALATHGSTACT